MSELTFKGDTVSKFGTYLPAPYISKIDLLDDRVTTYISIFLVSSGDDTIDEAILAQLESGINIYCMHSWAAPNETDQFGFSESDWQSVLNGDVNIFKALYDARQNSDISSYNLAQLTALSTDTGAYWSKAEDSYTEQGQKIIRYETNVQYVFADSAATFGTSLEMWFEDPPEFWYTYAFISTYEYDATTIEDELENIRLLANKTSDVSYEKVYSEGIIRRLYTEYFDSDDVIYDDIPLQSLGGFYYTTSGISHDQIRTYFENLVTEFQTTTTVMTSTTSSDLNNMLDNISSTLSQYGYTADIIVQLNYLRDLFPSKSNGDIVGQLYLKFRKRIYNVNQAAESGTLLNSRITRNPKIIDSRTPAAVASYATSSHNDDWESNHNSYLYDNSYYSLNEYLNATGDSVYYNKGYFFFDYEKAYRETSELSTYINVNKLHKLFSMGPVYEKFRVHHAKVTRTETTSTGGEYTRMLSTNLYTNRKYPQSQYYSSEATAPSSTYDAIAGLGSYENSYMVLRNVLPVEEPPRAFGSEEVDNYLLMCLEFVDEFGTRSPTNFDEYEVQVAITDNSIEVLDEIAAQYQEVITELEEYVNSAKEDCAHDTVTGEFKPFFIDAMDNLYGDNLQNSPWYRSAIMYNLHRDLLLDTFDGDMEKILEAVQEIVDIIGPYTGNKFSLDTFQTNFETLYDSLYVNSIPGYDGPSSSDSAYSGDSGGASTEAEDEDSTDESADDSGTPSDDPFSDGYSGGSSDSDDDEAMESADEDAEDPTEEGLSEEDLESADSSSDDESGMLIYTNTYTIANTSDAGAGMPPGELAYYMSYRGAWTTTAGFTTVEWTEWVYQVNLYQSTIVSETSSGTASALYSFMASLMENALSEETGGWAQIMTDYETVFDGGDLLSLANATLRLGSPISEDAFANASDSSTDLWAALTGWLRYMWGAINSDGVLEPNDVSNGYST